MCHGDVHTTVLVCSLLNLIPVRISNCTLTVTVWCTLCANATEAGQSTLQVFVWALSTVDRSGGQCSAVLVCEGSAFVQQRSSGLC